MTAPHAPDPSSTSAPKLALELVSQMGDITKDRIMAEGLANAQANQAYIAQGQSIKALHRKPPGSGERALVLAAGPSLHRKDVAAELRARPFEGALIATESSMLYCLRHGLVPDLVVTLDPHPKRIVRWFGDPTLSAHDLREDDYFARQDLDKSFADQLQANEQIMQLLDRYGKGMRIAISTSASAAVVQRARETGMDIYWWNPMYDDPDQPGSVTRRLLADNGMPCVNAGGNVGSAAWMMAHAVLNKRHVAVTGMDLGYYDDTPYRNTQYYREAVALVGEARLDEIFVRIHNPHLDAWFYTDPAYLWYRNCFLEMAADADCVTYNCTEGGTLFGPPIRFLPLRDFLTAPAQTASA